jgi:predicted RNase H-like nuclease (RuvC/YqgF family)
MLEIERIPVGDSLQEKFNKLQENYDAVIKKQYHNDYLVENQKNVIENLHKTLERYETENKAMRTLLQLWI